MPKEKEPYKLSDDHLELIVNDDRERRFRW